MNDETLRFDAAIRNRARSRLDHLPPPRCSDPGRAAAVGVVLVPTTDGEAGFLITRRTSRLTSHPGQWALPGGRIDAGETAADAAGREVAEELGLRLGP